MPGLDQIKHGLLDAGLKALSGNSPLRRLGGDTRGLGAILMFHHVRPWVERTFAPNRGLEITPAFLDAVLGHLRALDYEIIPLGEVPSRLAQPLKRRFVALTFDDGYRDNLEHALPILRRHAAPFTLFLTTGFLDRTAELWWGDLEVAIAGLGSANLPPEGAPVRLDTVWRKRQAFERLRRSWARLPEAEFRAQIAQIATMAGIDTRARVAELCFNWDEVRLLAKDPLAAFGAHTLTHPMLARQDAATSRREMQEAKHRLEAELGRAITSIAYPVGDRLSAGPREFALAKDVGFELGLTTRPGLLFPEHAAFPTALPRLSVNGFHQSSEAFDALLGGVPFWLLNRGSRVNAV